MMMTMLLIKQCDDSWLLGFNSCSFSVSLFVVLSPDVFQCHVVLLQAQNVDLDTEIATARKHQLFEKFVRWVRVENGVDEDEWKFGDSLNGDPHEDLVQWVTFLHHQQRKIEDKVFKDKKPPGADASVKATGSTIVKSTAATAAARAESLAGQADIRNSFAMGSKLLHEGLDVSDGQKKNECEGDDGLEKMLETLMDEEEAAEAAAEATVRSTPTPAKAAALPSVPTAKTRGRSTQQQKAKDKERGGVKGPVIRKCVLEDHVVGRPYE